MQTISKFKELYAHIKIEKRLLRIVLLGLLISTFFWTIDVTGPYWLAHGPAVRHIPYIGAYKLPLGSALRNGMSLILYISMVAPYVRIVETIPVLGFHSTWGQEPRHASITASP